MNKHRMLTLCCGPVWKTLTRPYLHWFSWFWRSVVTLELVRPIKFTVPWASLETSSTSTAPHCITPTVLLRQQVFPVISGSHVLRSFCANFGSIIYLSPYYLKVHKKPFHWCRLYFGVFFGKCELFLVFYLRVKLRNSKKITYISEWVLNVITFSMY